MPRGKAEKSLTLIEHAIEILAQIKPCGVRAVCYQLFIRQLTPSMAKTVTNEVGRHLGDAADAGLFDWHWLVDDTRIERGAGTWSSFGDLLQSAQRGFRRDRWQDQAEHCVVFSEKNTVLGTIAPVLDAYGVDFLPLHGHSSDSKLRQWCEYSRTLARPLHVFNIGDYDVAGMDMSERDLRARIRRYRGNILLHRIALVREDTLEPDAEHPQRLGAALSYPASDKGPRCKKCNRPWTGPTSARCPCGGEYTRGDLRYPWYVRTYGQRCWELDALNPNVLRQHVTDAIRSLIDFDAWRRAELIDEGERAAAAEYIQTWESFRAAIPGLNGHNPSTPPPPPTRRRRRRRPPEQTPNDPTNPW